MTPRLLLLLLTAVSIAPAVLWSIVSIVTAVVSITYRPISLCFRLYTGAGSTGAFEYHELPLLSSVSIIAGAALLIFGITSIPRHG